MARIMLSLAGGGSSFSFAYLPAATIGLFVAVLILVALCAKRKLSNKDRRREELGTAAAAGNQGRKADAGDGGGIGYAGEEEGFGDGGLWQKSILMGDKCRPLEFSGVIYYDDSGNRVAEMPRSPNVAPLAAASPIRSFTFPTGSPPKLSY